MQHRHTTASKRGDQTLWQCSNCGSVICSTRGEPAGPCPACLRQQMIWFKQEPPIAMFDN